MVWVIGKKKVEKERALIEQRKYEEVTEKRRKMKVYKNGERKYGKKESGKKILSIDHKKG